MAKNKRNLVLRIQDWIESVSGQTFLNYAYSWGAAVVILGALFKLTHIPGANAMLFIGMGTEVLVFFISGFDRPAALKQEEEELGRLDVAEDGELDEGGEEDVSQYFASRLKNSYGQHAYAPKLFERFDLLHDEIPLQSDTALRKRTGADLRASYGELEESAAEETGISLLNINSILVRFGLDRFKDDKL